jgi:alkylhydroperoxidase family enzyme
MSDDPAQWRPRISPADPGSFDERERRIFESQTRKWGAPLANHLIYARVESIFHGAQAMWRGLDSAGRLDSSLIALINRRVALINGCVF